MKKLNYYQVHKNKKPKRIDLQFLKRKIVVCGFDTGLGFDVLLVFKDHVMFKQKEY